MQKTFPEWQSADAREATQLAGLNALLPADQALSTLSDLPKLPLLRKSDLTARQAQEPPFGGIATGQSDLLFQSPGPIYEAGGTRADYWRFAAYMRACDIGAGDIAQNTFSYHFTPAGAMFQNAAVSAGAKVFAAGPGQSEEQAKLAAHIGTTVYAGTPDFLGQILAKADLLGLRLPTLSKAIVSAGPLFPQMREAYADRGIVTRQCYATADIGMIAYETEALDGLIVDDGCIVEVVTPGTGTPVALGEVGEVVVTILNPDYPLIRFATGDLSSLMPGISSCGRTNVRLSGWKGRADQATKVRGMFIRPEQVAALVANNAQLSKARVEVSLSEKGEVITVLCEGDGLDEATLSSDVKDALKLRADVKILAPGSLPNDGIVVADKRPIDP